MGHHEHRRFRYFDNHSSLIYFSVIESEEKKRRISKRNYKRIVNICIFDQDKESSKMLFERDLEEKSIHGFIFEAAHRGNTRTIDFEGRYIDTQNNRDIASRKPKDRLLLSIHNPQSSLLDLVSFNKQGEHKESIASIEVGSDWFIDVFHQKIRLIRQVQNRIQIDNYDW